MNRALFGTIVILAAALPAAATDYVALGAGTDGVMGNFGGPTKPFRLTLPLPAAPAALEADGSHLLAFVGDTAYNIGPTSGDVVEEAKLSESIIDAYRSSSGRVYALTPSGVQDIWVPIIVIPSSMLPANPRTLAALPEGNGDLVVVAGTTEIRSFFVDGGTMTPRNASPIADIRDLATGHVMGSDVLVAAVPLGVQPIWPPELEPGAPRPVNNPIAVKWPCDAQARWMCYVIAQQSDGVIVTIDLEGGRVEPAGSVPSGMVMGSTRGEEPDPILGIANLGTGAPAAPEMKVLTPGGFTTLNLGGIAGEGAMLDFGDVVGEADGTRGDGVTDAIVTSYSLSGNATRADMVAVYTYDTVNRWQKGVTFVPYADRRFGSTAVLTDLDYDREEPSPADEVITGPGPGPQFGPHVRAWKPEAVPEAMSKVNLFAYGTLRYGVNVAAGSRLRSKRFVTGAGPGTPFGPHVRGWSAEGQRAEPIAKINFFAFQYSTYGANVAFGDVEDDGFEEILVGPGPGATHLAEVRLYNYDDQAVTLVPNADLLLQGYSGANRVQGHYGARGEFIRYRANSKDYQVAVAIGPDPDITKPEVDAYSLTSASTKSWYPTTVCSQCGLSIGANGR